MGLLRLLKNLVLLAKNAPKIPGIIAQLASPNFMDNVASIMVEQEMADELRKIEDSDAVAIEQIRNRYSGRLSDEEVDARVAEIEGDTFDRAAFMAQAVKQKRQQIEPPISAALTPVTAAFGVPVFLTFLIKFLSAGGRPQSGLNVGLDSDPNDPTMEAELGGILGTPTPRESKDKNGDDETAVEGGGGDETTKSLPKDKIFGPGKDDIPILKKNNDGKSNNDDKLFEPFE